MSRFRRLLVPMWSLMHMAKIRTEVRPVNGTKVVMWSLTVILCLGGICVRAATAGDAGLTDDHEWEWPKLTIALLMVMVFYTWWLQLQHRRRMEQANDRLLGKPPR